MGNNAIARGAIEAGVKVVAGYPGTPSSEILSTIARDARKYGMHVEWSTNEKVAYEVAYGAALSGVRALMTTKHLGVNVLSDALLVSAYTGVNGGLVIVTADDIHPFSS
ncbi:indolepyruvate ferredoxin oxidoreductase subunit alpha, partial [archaeon]|nr:indolepyruvate ferredoxin oxidoreductase subunit alpha [archaeon]